MEEAGEILAIFYAQQSVDLSLHVTKEAPSKKLHDGYSCSHGGFLIKDLKREISVKQSIIH